MKKAVVVDTNVAVKWVLKEPDSGIAQALLAEWIDKEITLLAPGLFAYEMANILYKNVRKGEISLERAKYALSKVLLSELELDFSQDPYLSTRAIELANKYGLPATYDAHFLALAEREGCELWTADSRMWRTVQGKIPWVRDLSEYQPVNDQGDEQASN
jgi:predicted nucleic acid-binding protein